MEMALVAVSLLAAVGFGAAIWLALAKARSSSEATRHLADKDVEIARLRADLEHQGEHHARALEAERERSEQRLESNERLQRELDDIADVSRASFAELSSKTLQGQTEQFLSLARVKLDEERAKVRSEDRQTRDAFEALIKPIQETLGRTEQQLAAFQKDRDAALAGLGEQIRSVNDAQVELRAETGRLTRALREPHIRGRYGEIQLKRVAELAGMSAYCDFGLQESSRDAEGTLRRPDMVVRLPNERVIAVDAKTNIRAYLEAIEAETPEIAEEHLERYAQHMADQVAALARKSYWKEYDHSPEFVVMFVPGDQFLDAALQRRPELLEQAAERRVILASPATLIGLLRAVAVGWRESKVAEDAMELRKLGEELHDRARIAFNHANELGDAIRRTVNSYNKFVGSVDTRLVPTLKRFEESGARSEHEIEPLPKTEITVRSLEAGQPVLWPQNGAGVEADTNGTHDAEDVEAAADTASDAETTEPAS